MHFESDPNGRRVLSLYKGQLGPSLAQSIVNAVADEVTAKSVSTHYSLEAGEWFLCAVYQNSGSDLNILVSGDSSPEFGMVKLP